MATAPLSHSQNFQPQRISEIPKKMPNSVIPLKIGFMGEQGTGKTASAGLLAAALSKQFHGGAPIHVTDPELGWQFLDPVIFQPEKIILVQRTVPTFAAMLKDLADAKKQGACVWAVELGKIWIEIIYTLQKQKPDNWGMELRFMWDDFVAHFLSSELHCLVLGRIQDIVEQVMTENGSVKSIKVGEGMKAGGQRNNFGYEPHLVIRMNREQKPRVKKGKTYEEEGRVIHRADVLKDRTWALNGKVFRWPDRDGYEAGDFKYVWSALQPHFTAVQKTKGFATLTIGQSSEELIDADGNSQWSQMRDRRESMSAEIKAHLDLFFGGRGQAEIEIRICVTDLIFGVKSKEAAEKLSLDKLERGYRILQAFERNVAPPIGMPQSREGVLRAVADAVIEYDNGTAEMQDLPF